MANEQPDSMGRALLHAYDSAGNVYVKPVTTFRDQYRQMVLCFGMPIAYKEEDVKRFLYSLTSRLCVDATGANHRGSPVYVARKNVKQAYEWAVAELKKREGA